MKFLVIVAACAALVTANHYVSLVLSDSPTAYFRLADPNTAATQSNEVNPSEPLTRQGTFASAAGRWPGDTRPEFALNTNQYYNAPQSNAFSPTSGSTSVEIWTYLTGGTAHRSPITNRLNSGGLRGYNFYVHPTAETGNEDRWSLWYGTGSGWKIAFGPTASYNQWTHVAFSHNANTNTGTFYVNGVAYGTLNYALVSMSGADTLRIGVGGDSAALRHFAWGGVLSDAAFYNANLAQSRWEARVNLAYVPPTLDPAVTVFCDEIADKCTALDAECTTIRNGHGHVLGAGTMTNQAGKDNLGEHTGSVTLSGESVVVTAVGTLFCLDFNCPKYNFPNGGHTNGVNGFLLNGVPTHSLIARFGNTGPWQYVGDGPTTLTGTGPLTFAYNDDNNNYADNHGSWFITIRADITHVADDCDATVATCNDMEQQCRAKIEDCPVL